VFDPVGAAYSEISLRATSSGRIKPMLSEHVSLAETPAALPEMSL